MHRCNPSQDVTRLVLTDNIPSFHIMQLIHERQIQLTTNNALLGYCMPKYYVTLEALFCNNVYNFSISLILSHIRMVYFVAICVSLMYILVTMSVRLYS